MTDDGDNTHSSGENETSSGSEKISRTEFWKLVVHERRSAEAEVLPIDGTLEERLRLAQNQGLAPNLRRQLAFVGPNEHVFEFQALGVKRYPSDTFDRSKAAHARGPEEAVAICNEADGWLAHGIYLMPARLRPGVESRHASPGRWFDIPKGGGTTDSDVEARIILAVDFDVLRPSGISATEEEMQRSVRVAQNAWSYLAHHLGESSLAYLHSGNGRQIHVALDSIAVNDQSKSALSGLLAGLAHLFNTPEVVVDEKLYDAKRILPACGTMKKKGAAGVAERPHRRTAIVAPENPTRVPLDKLVELARHIWEGADQDGRSAIESAFGIRPRSTSNVLAAPRNPGSPFDIAKAVDPQRVAEWLGLYNARGDVVCPGCGETSGVAVLNKGLKCHHNRCKDRGLRGFRNNVELVAEVHRITAKEAVVEIGERFGLDLRFRSDPQQPPPVAAQPAPTQQQQQQPTPEQPATAAPAPAPAPFANPGGAGPFAYASRFTKNPTSKIFEPLPPINWLVQGLHLVAGRPTLIAGYGFSGKTLAAQAVGLGLASCSPVWGKFMPTTAVKVWHLDYEQGSYATHKRYQRLALGHGIPVESLADRLETTIFPDVYLDSPDAVDVYSRAVEGVAVCALDALRGATPTMDENDSTIRRCLDNLSRISEKTGTAFIVLHHAGKSRDSDTSDPRKIPRGSSAIFDACGCVFAIEGEKNEPKLVSQTKAPAEAEGNALEDFYIAIADVPGEAGPTAGLRVSYQDARSTAVQVATDRLAKKKSAIVDLVRSMPGQLTSSTSIYAHLGGKKEQVMAAVRELTNSGVIVQNGGPDTPFTVAREPVPAGSQERREPVPGSPPFRGEPGHVHNGTEPPREPERDRERERAATAEADAAELDAIDIKDWKAHATTRGWGVSRYGSARALAKSRLDKARADAVALGRVQARGEDPCAWATEHGWDDLRIRSAMRHVPAPKSGPLPTDSGD